MIGLTPLATRARGLAFRYRVSSSGETPHVREGTVIVKLTSFESATAIRVDHADLGEMNSVCLLENAVSPTDLVLGGLSLSFHR